MNVEFFPNGSIMLREFGRNLYHLMFDTRVQSTITTESSGAIIPKNWIAV